MIFYVFPCFLLFPHFSMFPPVSCVFPAFLCFPCFPPFSNVTHVSRFFCVFLCFPLFFCVFPCFPTFCLFCPWRKHRKPGGNKGKLTLGTRGFSCLKKTFCAGHYKDLTAKKTALAKSLPPRVGKI